MDLNHQSCFSTGFTVRPATSYGLPTRIHLSLILSGFLCKGFEPLIYGVKGRCAIDFTTPLLFMLERVTGIEPYPVGYLTAYYPLQHCPSPLPAIYFTRLLDTYEQIFGFNRCPLLLAGHTRRYCRDTS